MTLLDGASLFLDLDGTLLDLIDRPEEVLADEDLRALIGDLDVRLGGRVAIVSGRSLQQLDAILGESCEAIALSGSHGCEHRWQGIVAQPTRPQSLDDVAQRFRAFAAGHAGATVEDKSYGVALHYRTAPAARESAHRLAATLAEQLGLQLQHGKDMVELRVAGGDKGTAVARLMRRQPMAGGTPIFVGDDDTDEAAFATVRDLGGAGILVGPARATAASYRLADPAAVRRWLREAMA